MDTQEIHLEQLDFLQQTSEPSIGFSPDRNRFESTSINEHSSVGSMDMNDLIMGNKESSEPPPHFNSNHQLQQKNKFDVEKVSGTIRTQSLQKRLEQHIAHANASSPTSNGVQGHHESPWGPKQGVINPSSSESTNNGKLKGQIPTSPNHSTTSALDSRTKALLPPGRLAIPRKSNSTTTSSAHLNSQEAKPLVQWDTDDSEEELSFFPQPKAKSRLTDNMSVDNLSLSGEEEDLHLAPPRLLPSGSCPCDPRPFLQIQLENVRRIKQNCQIV